MYVSIFTLSALLQPISACATIYAATSDGRVSVLTFSGSQISLKSSITACGENPSWLTEKSGVLYCSNEATPGSLTTLRYENQQNELFQQNIINTIGGDVHSVWYGGGGFLAIAHYGHGSISTFDSSLRPLQKLFFASPSSPHQVISGPDDKFLFSPDLGADVVRIFSIDPGSGTLSPAGNLTIESGSGPRHIAFYQPSPNGPYSIMYLVSELSNTLSGFRMEFNPISNTPTFTLIVPPFVAVPTSSGGTKAFVSELHVFENTLTISSRGDGSFGLGVDSLKVFKINPDGTLLQSGIYPSYGNYSRSFDINKNGDMVVVGNQLSNTTAVIARNTTTGKLRELKATLKLSGQVMHVAWAQTQDTDGHCSSS